MKAGAFWSRASNLVPSLERPKSLECDYNFERPYPGLKFGQSSQDSGHAGYVGDEKVDLPEDIHVHSWASSFYRPP